MISLVQSAAAVLRPVQPLEARCMLLNEILGLSVLMAPRKQCSAAANGVLAVTRR